MAKLQGYCPNCPCWFAIPDPNLQAHRLCPCCLQPATRTRHATLGVLQPGRWPVVHRLRRIVTGLIPH